jgi:S1-C subfamily serine protease
MTHLAASAESARAADGAAMVHRLLGVILLATLTLGSSVAHGQGVPESRQLQINSALQDALAWLGLYDGLADGAIGEKSIAAISQFQRRQGWAPTGDLDPTQKIELLRVADAARRQVGFQVVSDRRSMLAIGLPTRLLATRQDTPRGSIYESADKQVEVILARFGREEGGLRAVYERVVNSPSMTGFSYRLIRSDAFFVAGFNSKREFYHSARVVENEVRGFTIAYPRERAAEFGPIIVAMGNSFKAPIADYTAIAQMINPSATPAVAGFVQRAQAAGLNRMSCDELWLARNEIFKAAGYCFQSERAIRQFGNAGCRYANNQDVPLSDRQRAHLTAITAAEVGRSCSRQREADAQRGTLQVKPDVSEGVLNLRTGPGTNFSIVASMPAGTAGISLAEPCATPAGQRGWCKISWSNLQGWASMTGLMDARSMVSQAPIPSPSLSASQVPTESPDRTPGRWSRQDEAVRDVESARRAIEHRTRSAGLVAAPMPVSISTHTISPADLFERIKDGIWTVIAADSLASLRDNDAALGSAVAVSPNELLTNCHVVGNKPLIGLLQGKTVLRARLSSSHTASDRCVLQVEAQLRPVAGVRSFRDLRVGERVYTIGSPQFLERTLAEGLISGLRSDSTSKWVQTTAPISPGSSGGGLFDDRGNLIGVTTFLVREAQQLNFAIAADDFWR